MANSKRKGAQNISRSLISGEISEPDWDNKKTRFKEDPPRGVGATDRDDASDASKESRGAEPNETGAAGPHRSIGN
jgi:hypothetical protein